MTNRNLWLTVLKAEKSTVKSPVDLVSDEDLSIVNGTFYVSLCDRKLPQASFTRVLNPIHKGTTRSPPKDSTSL